MKPAGSGLMARPIPPQNEAEPSTRRKAMILGGGPNRIGQGIEFDYCCCHAAFAMADLKIESIMVNCNPETVSTDYDTSDRLYFEPLTLEDVSEIIHLEQTAGDFLGVIVQFGGQTPLKLAQGLKASGAPILGTTPDSIDLAEDREQFSQLLDKIGLKQAPSAIARTDEEAIAAANRIGYPGHAAPQLRARRPRDGDRVRREGPAPLRARGCAGFGRYPAAGRPLSVGRHRSRRRRHVRRHRHACRRHHGAYRGSRHSLR
jgi:hypothetical protein